MGGMNIKQAVFAAGVVAVVGVFGITLVVVIARNNLPPPKITLSVSPAQTFFGKEVRISWSVTGADGCSASGDWSGERDAERGSERVTAERTEQVYVLTCVGPGGDDEEKVTLTAEGTSFTFTATPIRVAVNGTTTLRWDAKGFKSCTASATPAVSGWSGLKSVSGQRTFFMGAGSSKTFRLDCRQSGDGTSVRRSVRVIVTDEPEPEPPERGKPLSYEEYFRTDRTAQCTIYSGKVNSLSDDDVTFGLSAPNIIRNLKYDQFTVFYECGVQTGGDVPVVGSEIKTSVCREQTGVPFVDAIDQTSGCE